MHLIHLNKKVFVFTSCNFNTLNSSRSVDFSFWSWIWMMRCKIGELFLEFGLTKPFKSSSRFSLYMSFWISMIRSNTIKISASALATEFKYKYFSSSLTHNRSTQKKPSNWPALPLKNIRTLSRPKASSCLACTIYRCWSYSTRRERSSTTSKCQNPGKMTSIGMYGRRPSWSPRSKNCRTTELGHRYHHLLLGLTRNLHQRVFLHWSCLFDFMRRRLQTRSSLLF